MGIFHGDSPASLQPLDLMGVQGPAAWPVVNPTFTSGGLKSYDGVRGPRMWQHAGRLFMYYEAISCKNGRRALGVAETVDDGVSWRGLGTILTTTTPDTLRRPYLFTYNNQSFMATDSAAGAKLHRCTRFPMGWHFNATLTEDPLRGISIFEIPDAEKEERWVMTGSLPSKGRRRPTLAGGDNSEIDLLAIYTASSPLGPWKQVPASPFSVIAGSPGGGIIKLANGELLRLGGICKASGKCSDAIARRFEFRDGVVHEAEFPPLLGERVWKQRSGWDAGGRGEVDVMALPSGRVAAVVLGHPLPPERPWYAKWIEIGLIVARGTAIGCALVLLTALVLQYRRAQGSWALPRFTRSPGSPWVSSLPSPVITPKSLAIQRLQAEERGEFGVSPRGRGGVSRRGSGSWGGGSGSTGLAANLASQFAVFALPSDVERGSSACSSPLGPQGSAGGSPGSARRAAVFMGGGALRRVLRGLVEVSASQLKLLAVVFILFGGTAVALGRVRSILEPFWVPAHAEAIGGQFSRFTLIVMSYESRRSLLEGYIRHYSQCPSVGEILIVWNRGNPAPDPAKDFPWASVPVRVRIELTNSLNNRYRPDPNLRFRGVLSLEDDLRIPCADVERTFATWRGEPNALTGFCPRLAEVSSTPRYQSEPEIIDKGWYNLILTGAAFIDSRKAFAAYWSEAVSRGRAVVDQVHNCDDLLMNFAIGNATKGRKHATVAYIRPSRRVDVSWWSGVGLSHAVKHFREDAEHCLVEFEKLFQGWPLRAEKFQWTIDKPKPICNDKSVLECSYLQ